MPAVPATVKVRPSRVRYIDSGRLARRHAYLVANRTAIARNADGRNALAIYAREVLTIRAELHRRFGVTVHTS